MSEMSVKEPLNWFWIFYRFDKINEKVTKKKKFIQKFKFYLTIILQILVISQNLFVCLTSDENNIKKIFLQFDVIRYIGSGHKSMYLCVAFTTILETSLLLLLNNSNT